MNQHIFFTKNHLRMEIIFLLQTLQKKNEAENFRFKKSLEHALTGLSINQDIGSGLVIVTDTDRLNFWSNIIQKLVTEKKIQIWTLKYPIQKKKIWKYHFNKNQLLTLSSNKTDILQHNNQKEKNWVLQLFSALSKVLFCLGTSPY